MAVWFHNLLPDRVIRGQRALKSIPFVLSASERGHLFAKAVSTTARQMGVVEDMSLADARAIVPNLQVMKYNEDLPQRLLNNLAEWCIRYSPKVAVDFPDGLVIDATGCPHLWGGEQAYLNDISYTIRRIGYGVKVAMADTIGAAWAVSRYGKTMTVVSPSEQRAALSSLPPEALRLDQILVERLHKLGLVRIGKLMAMKPSMLRRRFGTQLSYRLGQALGTEAEVMVPITPAEPYREILSSLEPIITATGIRIAVERLLEALCMRLEKDGKGLRKCTLRCHRVDGHVQEISITVGRPSRVAAHLLRLFDLRISVLQPDLGFEQFVLEAPFVEDIHSEQQLLWDMGRASQEVISQMLDRIAGRFGQHTIHSYRPEEHYWPERSIKAVEPFDTAELVRWPSRLDRPIHMLLKPEPIAVTAPQPDYPPIVFNYKDKRVQVAKADGPERIEEEWWLSEGLYRDYYSVEGEEGVRYWIFRLGSYEEDRNPQWFLHGIFA